MGSRQNRNSHVTMLGVSEKTLVQENYLKIWEPFLERFELREQGACNGTEEPLIELAYVVKEMFLTKSLKMVEHGFV